MSQLQHVVQYLTKKCEETDKVEDKRTVIRPIITVNMYGGSQEKGLQRSLSWFEASTFMRMHHFCERGNLYGNILSIVSVFSIKKLKKLLTVPLKK